MLTVLTSLVFQNSIAQYIFAYSTQKQVNQNFKKNLIIRMHMKRFKLFSFITLAYKLTQCLNLNTNNLLKTLETQN